MSTEAWPKRQFNIFFVGETTSHLRKIVLLIKTHIDPTTVQYEDERDTYPATSHINTFSRVVSELSSQGINFEEEVKALALLSSLPASWEVICTTFANNCPKLNLDETINQVLIEDIRRESMGIIIDDSAEGHFSTEPAGRTDWRTNRSRRGIENRQRSMSRNYSQSSAFCTHCKKTGHDISHYW